MYKRHRGSHACFSVLQPLIWFSYEYLGTGGVIVCEITRVMVITRWWVNWQWDECIYIRNNCPMDYDYKIQLNEVICISKLIVNWWIIIIIDLVLMDNNNNNNFLRLSYQNWIDFIKFEVRGLITIVFFFDNSLFMDCLVNLKDFVKYVDVRVRQGSPWRIRIVMVSSCDWYRRRRAVVYRDLGLSASRSACRSWWVIMICMMVVFDVTWCISLFFIFKSLWGTNWFK